MKGDMHGYTLTVGLEVHAELATTTKMFCGCRNAPHASEPNSNICPICMGHPGTLPTVNKEAVRKVLEVGTALGATLASYTEFDRKNYFYPDIPKGYQISQYAYPLVKGGELSGVHITRVHLEEDTARSSHEHQNGSLVDYNRAGVPLMELVTEPVIHDAEVAGNFARELQLLLRELTASEANMEKGEMRVEANISVSKNAQFGTKVEVKNLNSFRSVEGAIQFEAKRQIALLEKGGVVIQETRGWDENKEITFSQRKKESSHDYRYFPDPDIPSFNVDKKELITSSRQSEILAKTPIKTREKYTNLGLASKQIETLLDQPKLRVYFDHVAVKNSEFALLASNYLTSDVVGLLASGALKSLETTEPHLEAFLELMGLVYEKKITSRVAKDILLEVLEHALRPNLLVESRGLGISSDSAALSSIIDEIIKEHTNVVADYKSGKVSAMQFLVGQGMKKTKGAANPESLKALFETRIN